MAGKDLYPPTATMQNIVARQKLLPPAHDRIHEEKPDTLLIGCVDARLDPERLGINLSKTLIRRTIAALVPKYKDGQPSKDLSETIKYALSHGIKHIVVMGHTCCGGLEACCGGVPASLPKVGEHLKILDESPFISGDIKHDIHKLEAASLHVSLQNLRTYPELEKAVEEGRITLTGLVADTHNHNIQEYIEPASPKSEIGTLIPLRLIKNPGDKAFMPSDIIRWSQMEPPSGTLYEDPSIHQPELLMITGIDTHINPAAVGISYGKALIYRGFDPCAVDRTDESAALQFAIKGKNVKDVVIMLPSGSESKIRQGISMLKENEEVIEALKNPEFHLRGWIIDQQTGRISEMDNKTGKFNPLGSHIVAQGVRI